MKIKSLVIIIFATFIFPDKKFEFNQSTIQAFYFIIDAQIYGQSLEEGVDWIIAYNGDLCVGARQWAGPYTDIPVMGDDGSDYSKGYIKSGEFPTFKIYDESEEIIYDATPSEQIAYPKGMVGMITLDSLNVEFDISEITQNKSANIQEIKNISTTNYQIYNQYKYRKPKSFTHIKQLPHDLKEYSKIVFNKNYLKEFVGLSLITGILIYFDEELIKKSRFMHDKLNISYTDQMQVLAEPFGQPIRVPSDLGSALYFVGDGWTHFGISMSFYLTGKIKNNNRALQTSSQILQGMASAGYCNENDIP